MEAASAVALRHLPPRRRLPAAKPASLFRPVSSFLSPSLPAVASSRSAACRRSTLAARVAPPSDAATTEGSGSEEPSTPAAPPEPPLPPKKPAAKGAGAGFGVGGGAEPKKRKGKQRGSVVRRAPVQKPSSLYSAGGGSSAEQQTVNESAFVLIWLGLGLLILIEGVLLAASGILPEQWDNFFVKYLYPVFTPTVFVFVGGTVAYGVFKYLQGEKQKG